MDGSGIVESIAPERPRTPNPMLVSTLSAPETILQVTDLVGRPGASRRVDLMLPVPDGLQSALVHTAPEVSFEGVLESIVDGIFVRGRVHTDAVLECARCLEPVTTALEVDVAELFTEPGRLALEDGEEAEPGYELVDGRIDLDALLRNAIGAAMPYRPLCREDCRGLCPTCGIDLNKASCNCVTLASDGRWAALEGLRLPDTDEGGAS